jgi:hypothetical protein
MRWLWVMCKSVFVHIFTWFILMSTQIYILSWIIWGASCLAFGVARNLKSTNPIYTTGQTWAGIAVTIAYSYFGLNGKNAPTFEDIKDTVDERIKDAVQRAFGGGGGDGANGGEVNLNFTDKRNMISFERLCYGCYWYGLHHNNSVEIFRSTLNSTCERSSILSPSCISHQNPP